MTTHYQFSDQTGHAVVENPSPADLSVRHRRGLYRNAAKRLFDVALVIMAAPFVLPLVLVLAVMVALNGGQPFYRQDRVGKDGRIYRMWKLRSMEHDADTRLAAHLASDPAAASEWSVNQKLRRDPRITRLGHILRRSSLDELPQLWNVLKGDMSLVGPRPMMPSQQTLYPGTAYYALRPGITGLWQVAARNDSSFAARAGYDSEYDRSLSLATDIRLLFATIRVVTRGTGC